ncbi:Rab guanine nucleotide exchange factor sec2 [Tolypocladium paradoxum]|uniref:Rab guanine nucleotide exchange factor sec2 n=1 Tax=Tolypocladium paradoxum TaxID=94208 RepID=A0A2S4KY23_9HYPO|nr:Rab guanine nucleotide exchange factor sec2 [Tolypocladium paradoxum]
MDSIIHVAGWSQHHQPSRPPSGRSFGHFRSLSSVAPTTSASSPSSPSPQKVRLPPKSPSTSQLPTISLTSSHSAPVFSSDDMSTLPDPRSRALSPASENSPSSPSHHPDLDDEVAKLSTKLINAINHQTVLDDTLSATRHDLQSARDRIRELELQNQAQRAMMAGDVWVRRSTLDAEKKAMQADKKMIQAKLAEETTKRLDTEKEKRKIEQELENLTTALFEEANKMVIGAKEEAQAQHEALRRKNDQLKAQLADSESLLKSQQEQLSELKNVMESMASEHDDQTHGTAPSSPGVARFDSADDDRPPPEGLTGAMPTSEGFTPCNPTSLQHLIQPVLRTDLVLYEDFVTLAHVSHQRPGSRVSSGSMGGLTALSLGLGGSTSSAHANNVSTTSLNASGPTTNSAPQSPNTPASTTSASSTTVAGAPIPNLKDTRFYKRVLAEDIEPTLRLDTAPGLSWLARRSVLTSMAEGSLVVEPVPQSASYKAVARPQYYPCSLCGEARKSTEHLRNHRFRTSEADSAQRYPLCSYCLARVRSTCGFLGFLRMVKDGHWRADDEDHVKAAWEESVKLREQMFWTRIGGGVVPAGQAGVPAPAETDKDSRSSQDNANATAAAQAENHAVGKNDVTKPGDETDCDDSVPQQDNPAAVKEPQTPPEQTEGRTNRRKLTQPPDTPSP